MTGTLVFSTESATVVTEGGRRATPGRARESSRWRRPPVASRSTCRRRAAAPTATSATGAVRPVVLESASSGSLLPEPLPAPAEVLMPVIVGGADRRPPRTPPPGRPGRPAAVLVLLYPGRGRHRPGRPDRACQPRRPSLRRGQLPRREGRARRRRHRGDRAARGGRGDRPRRRRRRRPGGRRCSSGSGSRSATSRSRRSWPSPPGGRR